MSDNIFEYQPPIGESEDSKYQELGSDVNEAFTKTLLSKLSEAILALNMEGVIQMANESALKLLNKDLVYQRFWDIFPDQALGFSMQEALCYGISHRRIYTALFSLELEVSTEFVYEGKKSEHRLIVFLKDITSLKKLQQLIARSDRMREVGETTAKLSHEIRNCLGGIRGFASLLFRDLSGEHHLQEMIGKIIEGTKSLEKLVSTVLVYARPIELNEQMVDLTLVVRQIALTFKIDPIFPVNVKFHLHIPNAPLLLPLDADAIKRALLNLLINAIQAMPNGGELTLSLLKCETNCQIALSDTGVGMKEEELSALFSPLFTTKKSGNGLGLVETKRIVQGHGGVISVRSILGRGTTFLMTFPLRRFS